LLRICAGQGNAASFKSILLMKKNTVAGVRNAMLRIGPDLVKWTQGSMREAKSGRTMKVYWSPSGGRLKRGRWHTASSQTETPAIVSGRLLRSLNFRVKGFSELVFGARGIDPDSGFDYGAYHEESGRTFLKRAMEQNKAAMRDTFIEEVEKAVMGAIK